MNVELIHRPGERSVHDDGRPLIPTVNLENQGPQLLAALAILLALCVLPGCASDTRAQGLNATLEAYRKTIRWDAARTAAQYLHPEERPNERQLSFQISRLEQFKVSGYQTAGPGNFDAEGQYVQTVQINLSNRHTAVEKVLTDRQSWQWDEERERWWLTSGLPDVSKAR